MGNAWYAEPKADAAVSKTAKSLVRLERSMSETVYQLKNHDPCRLMTKRILRLFRISGLDLETRAMHSFYRRLCV